MTPYMTSYLRSMVTLEVVCTVSEIQRDVAADTQLQLCVTLSETSRGLSMNYEAVICIAYGTLARIVITGLGSACPEL